MRDNYPNAQFWHEARVNFVRSCAAWSVVGYVIGLGDRHGDNILFHQHTGEISHVDFDCIFEKGLKLKVPEIVPFRMTRNIVDCFGLFKEKGTFTRTSEITLRVLKKNHRNIMSFLETFLHDPLIEGGSSQKISIDEALKLVKKKLKGTDNAVDEVAITVEE